MSLVSITIDRSFSRPITLRVQLYDDSFNEVRMTVAQAERLRDYLDEVIHKIRGADQFRWAIDLGN